MNRNFVLLWQGQFVSQLGSQAFTIAMMFWLKEVTGSATVMGAVMMASLLPMAILSPLGGVAADRFSRRGIIIACDLVNGVAVLSLAALMLTGAASTPFLVGWLFGVSVVGGILHSLFMPAIKAAIPSIVPSDRVAAANSLNEASTEVSTLVGQGVGGVLFRVLGAPVLFLVDGVSYLVSAASEAFITIPQTRLPAPPSLRAAARDAWRDLAAGMVFVRSRRGMPELIGTAAVINFFAMPFFVLLPFFVEDTLHRTSDWYGYLLAAFGGAGIAGYAVAGVVRWKGAARGAALSGCLVGVALGMGALGLARTAWHALALMAATGVLHGFFHVTITTLLQTRTPEELRGRVFGVLHALVMGLAPFAMGLSGVVADALDQNVRLVFVMCGAVLFVTAVVAVSSRALRDFLSGDGNDTESQSGA
jgi:MFS family permease